MHFQDYRTNTRRTKSITYDKDTARNRKEAECLLKQMIDGERDPEEKTITIRILFDEYLKDSSYTLKQSTYIRNKRALDSVARILGEDTIVSRMSARYVRQSFLQTGLPGTQLNGYLKRFKTAFMWGYRNDLIQNLNKIDTIQRFPEKTYKEKIQDKYMETEELQQVLNAMDHREWKLVTKFLALSGLRIGELIALRKSDVNLSAGTISVKYTYDLTNGIVTTAKTDASADDVVIQPQLESVIRDINALMLRKRLQYGFTTNLFVFDNTGSYMHYPAFNKYLKASTEKVLGRALTTHSLRHTHASLLFEQGFTIDEVARRLRHEDSKITRDVYVHITRRLKEKDADKLKKTNLL